MPNRHRKRTISPENEEGLRCPRRLWREVHRLRYAFRSPGFRRNCSSTGIVPSRVGLSPSGGALSKFERSDRCICRRLEWLGSVVSIGWVFLQGLLECRPLRYGRRPPPSRWRATGTTRYSWRANRLSPQRRRRMPLARTITKRRQPIERPRRPSPLCLFSEKGLLSKFQGSRDLRPARWIWLRHWRRGRERLSPQSACHWR